MTRLVEWDGKPFAVLIEPEHGEAFLARPIVLDEHGTAVDGQQALAAIVHSGISIELPVVRNPTPAVLAEIDDRMVRLAAQLGVPIGTTD